MINNQEQEHSVTVVIPTYKRADILPYMLEALKRQTYRTFDIIMVVKPSGDDTQKILKQASNGLKITIIIQNSGHIVDAYFLGAKRSTGSIVAFLDDDALPAEDWLEETVKVFKTGKVHGITGDSFPVLIKKDGNFHIIQEKEIPSILWRYEFAFFGRPLKGLEGYKNCITDSGLVFERGNNAFSRKRGASKALLRGPSMAISGDILRSINLPGEWILGCAWEMVLGWQLWKQGLTMVYTPQVKVYHIVHGRTASRDFLNPRTDLLWAVESELLFYRLYKLEPQFSIIRKICSDIVRTIHTMKYFKTNHKYYTAVLAGMFLANIIGAKWIIYKKIKCAYSPIRELKRLYSITNPDK